MESVYEVVRIRQEVSESQLQCDKISTPDEAAKIAYDYIGDDDREVILAIALNIKNRVISVHRAHIGGLHQSVATPREIFKSAIINNAASIIVAHQHPSGETHASQEDIDVAKRLYEAGKILGMELLDNLVIGEYYNGMLRYTSLKEKDVLV